MKWEKMEAEERMRVVELARSGEVNITQLCEEFGMTRQSLRRAMEKMDEAALDALKPKKRGRKPPTQGQQRIRQLEQEKAQLQNQLEELQTKYEVASKYIELSRTVGSEGAKKKRRRSEGRASRRSRRAQMVREALGRGAGDNGTGPEAVEGEEEGGDEPQGPSRGDPP